ncbi:hypothetical protein NLG97_g314 [Lecanicillium saksenae]|uniref:Uncharacterized protein n=1 Tax=Lecanicillium saksenae TaxID=468837 RepID=A0ACC1R9N4_9HYPO|nr:hypothetical protein NLG97_g314 [Lecanicillium saksenae]
MLLSTILTPIALAATVLADGAAINSALKEVDKDIQALTSSLNGFSGDIFAAIPLLGVTDTLDKAIKKATQVATDSQPLTSDDTVSLANTVSTIITDATASIDAFIAVKPKFDKLYIVTPIAAGLVKTLKKDTGALGDAIIAKVPADFKDVATQLVDQINAQFDRGIAAYGSSGSGGSPLPGFPGGGSGGSPFPGFPGGGSGGGSPFPGFPGSRRSMRVVRNF